MYSSNFIFISGNISDSLAAVAAKGVTVPSGSTSDDLAGLIAQISGGGGTTWTTLLDNDVTVTADNPNYFTYSPYTTPFDANETYRVTWGTGGTQYLCNTYTMPAGISYDGYGIGNTVFGGGPDTGEPFGMYRNNSSTLVCATTASAGIVHVKIEKQVSSGGATLITKSITQNGTYNAEDDDADGYSSVTVNVSSSGTGAISIVDTTDTAGGTIRTITAVDISDTTATASDVLNSKWFYAADGTKTQGTATGGGSSVQTDTGTFTGNDTVEQTISCSFAPDLIYVYGDLSGTASLRGVVSVIIVKDTYVCGTGDGSSGSYSPYITTEANGITSYNESNTSSAHASYSNGTLTINMGDRSSSTRFNPSVTYSYKLVKWS